MLPRQKRMDFVRDAASCLQVEQPDVTAGRKEAAL